MKKDYPRWACWDCGTKHGANKKQDHPNWACWDCGTKHGANKQDRISTWHYGKCDVCDENKNVTEPRDYGHFPNWFKEKGNK